MSQLPKRVKHQLSKHKLLQQAIKTAEKDGYLEISIDSCQSWNFDGTSTPKVDGTFDVDGHSCCDVRVRVYTPFLSPNYWRKAVGGWLKDLTDVRSWNVFKIHLKYHPFTRYFDGWLWIVDSFQVAKSYYAEEIVDLLKPGLLLKRDSEVRRLEIAKVETEITDDQFKDYLKLKGVKLNKHLYATETDYTCMVSDETTWPKFDLKDGWSNCMIRSIVVEWWLTTNQPYTIIKLRKNDESK